jgi:RNA polymerase sigma-70 factor, ECF subfamily
MSASAREVRGWTGTAAPCRVVEREREREIFALVYRQMRAITAARSREVDDLVQVALEKVLRGLPSYEGRAELSTWTYRICYLTFISHERWAARTFRRFVLGASVPEPADPLPSAVESLEQRERADRLRRALSLVSAKRRAVVVLHDLEGLGLDEISRVVGAKRNTVKSRLRDGHRELARVLVGDAYFGDEACRLAAREGEP